MDFVLKVVALIISLWLAQSRTIKGLKSIKVNWKEKISTFGKIVDGLDIDTIVALFRLIFFVISI